MGDLVALVLHGDVEPVLLFYRVALSLVVAGGVSLLRLLVRGVMERLAQDVGEVQTELSIPPSHPGHNKSICLFRP